VDNEVVKPPTPRSNQSSTLGEYEYQCNSLRRKTIDLALFVSFLACPRFVLGVCEVHIVDNQCKLHC
jgi:hypothetical protein